MANTRGKDLAPRMKTDGTVEELLKNKCKRKGSCLIFQGSKYRDGYGRQYWNGKLDRAHRVVYSEMYGEIPEGMVVRHTCNNPSCCEPSHLKLGTHKDNAADMIAAGHNVGGRKKGRKNLTREQISAIENDTGNKFEVAIRHNVSVSTVQRIRRNNREE